LLPGLPFNFQRVAANRKPGFHERTNSFLEQFRICEAAKRYVAYFFGASRAAEQPSQQLIEIGNAAQSVKSRI
jgi:hypothetical protein